MKYYTLLGALTKKILIELMNPEKAFNKFMNRCFSK